MAAPWCWAELPERGRRFQPDLGRRDAGRVQSGEQHVVVGDSGALVNQLTILPGGQLQLDTAANKFLDTLSLINQGTVTWNAGQLLNGGQPATVVSNGGRFSLQWRQFLQRLLRPDQHAGLDQHERSVFLKPFFFFVWRPFALTFTNRPGLRNASAVSAQLALLLLMYSSIVH